MALNTKAQKFGIAYQKNSKNLTTPNLNINMKLIYCVMNRPLTLNFQKKIVSLFFFHFIDNQLNFYLDLYNHVGSRGLEDQKFPSRLPGTSQTANQTILLTKIIARVHRTSYHLAKYTEIAFLILLHP